MTLDRTVAILQSVSGSCPVCLAALKWAEIRHTDHPDGTRKAIRVLVCKNNHHTIVAKPMASR